MCLCTGSVTQVPFPTTFCTIFLTQFQARRSACARFQVLLHILLYPRSPYTGFLTQVLLHRSVQTGFFTQVPCTGPGAQVHVWRIVQENPRSTETRSNQVDRISIGTGPHRDAWGPRRRQRRGFGGPVLQPHSSLAAYWPAWADAVPSCASRASTARIGACASSRRAHRLLRHAADGPQRAAGWTSAGASIVSRCGRADEHCELQRTDEHHEPQRTRG